MTQRNNFETAEFPPRAGSSGSLGPTSTSQDTLANETGAFGVAPRARRATRIALSLPVTLHDQFGGQHQARTQSVMTRGAIVTSTSNLRVGHKLTIQNLKSSKSAECHVIAIEPGIGSSNTLEIEFTGVQPDFWPVQFPSENSHSTTFASASLTSADQLSLADDISAPSGKNSVLASPRIPARETELVSLADSVEQNFVPPIPAQKPVVQRTPPPTDSVALFRAANRAAHRRQQQMKTLYSVASVLALVGLGFAGKNWLSHRPEATVQPEAIAPPAKVAKSTTPTTSTSTSTSPSNTVANVFAALKSTPSKVIAHIKLPASITKTTPAEPITSAAETAIPAETKPQMETQPAEDSQVTVRHGSSLASSRKASQDSGEEPIALPLTASIPASAQPKPEALSAVVAPAVPPRTAVLAQQVPKQTTSAKLTFSVPAQYPAIARQLRTEGEVVLNLDIDPTGKVSDAKVISGPPILRTAALDSVRRWKYEPAIVGDKPVPSTQTVKVDFRLK